MGGRFTETVGQYLSRERESRSVSLDELSRETRISRPFLEALERDDFQFFSQREFIAGFLKGYARHLGVDVEEVLRRYHIQVEFAGRKEVFRQLPLFPDPSALPEALEETPPTSRPSFKILKKRNPHLRILFQIAIILVAVGLTFYLHYLMKKTGTKTPLPLHGRLFSPNPERTRSAPGNLPLPLGYQKAREEKIDLLQRN